MPTGYIYKIWSLQSDEIYIGSTKCFRKRKSTHKKTCNNDNDRDHNLRVYQHIRAHGGWDAWFMNVIEQIEYTHKWELETREAHHIRDLNASLNCKIPTQTRAEHYQSNRERILEQRKQYRESNPEVMRETWRRSHQKNRESRLVLMKQQYQANREAKKEKAKKYYQVNRERVAERNKQKIVCECGAQLCKGAIRAHQKTKKHHKLFYQKVYEFIYS